MCQREAPSSFVHKEARVSCGSNLSPGTSSLCFTLYHTTAQSSGKPAPHARQASAVAFVEGTRHAGPPSSSKLIPDSLLIGPSHRFREIEHINPISLNDECINKYGPDRESSNACSPDREKIVYMQCTLTVKRTDNFQTPPPLNTNGSLRVDVQVAAFDESILPQFLSPKLQPRKFSSFCLRLGVPLRSLVLGRPKRDTRLLFLYLFRLDPVQPLTSCVVISSYPDVGLSSLLAAFTVNQSVGLIHRRNITKCHQDKINIHSPLVSRNDFAMLQGHGSSSRTP